MFTVQKKISAKTKILPSPKIKFTCTIPSEHYFHIMKAYRLIVQNQIESSELKYLYYMDVKNISTRYLPMYHIKVLFKII